MTRNKYHRSPSSKITKSSKDISTLTNDFIGNLSNVSNLVNVVLHTNQAVMLAPGDNHFTIPITISLGALQSVTGDEVNGNYNYINHVNGRHTITENITDIGENNATHCARHHISIIVIKVTME